jgi:hypothetical protein
VKSSYVHHVSWIPWLRSEVIRLSQALIWCLADFRIREENGEVVSVEDYRRLDHLSAELHHCTNELRSLSATAAVSC